MTFREILAQLIDQTEGALAGAVMAGDGIPIDEYGQTDQVDLAALAVELQPMLEQVRKATSSVYEGAPNALQEMILATEKHQILLRPIDGEFFLLIVLTPEGILGKMRYLTRMVLHDLRETL
ncbi:MAG: roadblock/LC7 domain-containing protein [bacterium]|nr:roadblock/LC7 domain-containing protein [bacterium]